MLAPRAFTMPFVDGEGRTFFSVIRPFRCTLGIPYICIYQPQEAELLDARGNTYAKAIELTPTCCGRNFDATDDQGRLIYSVSSNLMTADNGKSNCCAPSCFNANFNVDIRDPRTKEHLDGFQVARLLLRWIDGSFALCSQVCAWFAHETKSQLSRSYGFD